MIDKPKGKSKHDGLSRQHVLMTAIGFNEDDLYANSEGYMSKRQRGKLSRNRKSWLNRISIIIVSLSILFVVLLLDNIRRNSRFGDTLMLIAVCCLLAALVMLYMWRRRSRLNDDLHKGDVYVAEGEILTHIQKIQNGQWVMNIYHAHIQDAHFTLDKTVFDAFQNGDPYVVYYAPHSKTILSAQWLREA